jgi:hypothetical protein
VAKQYNKFMSKKTPKKTVVGEDIRGMYEFWVSPNTITNGILWLVGFAMQIGGGLISQ